MNASPISTPATQSEPSVAPPKGRPQVGRPRGKNVNLRISAILLAVLLVSGVLVFELDVTHKSSSAPPNPPPRITFRTPIHHVIVLFMEDQNVSDVLAYGPFERYLAQHYAFASNYNGNTSDSLKNYRIAMSGPDYTAANTTTVPAQIVSAGGTWGAYMESMPLPCDEQNDSAVGYSIDHDPFVHYTGIISNLSYCDSHVQALNVTSWNEALASDSLPNYVWVTPNTTDDDHECSGGDNNSDAPSCIPHGDAWLKNFLSPFINSTSFSDSVVFLTYDYNRIEHSNRPALIYMAAISRYAHFDYTSETFYTHFDLLTTTEWFFYLPYLDGSTLHPPLLDLFDFGASYTVRGTVMANGSAASGAIVRGEGYNVTTDSNGGFELPLPDNASYTLTAARANGSCVSVPQTFTVAGSNLTLDFSLSC